MCRHGRRYDKEVCILELCALAWCVGYCCTPTFPEPAVRLPFIQATCSELGERLLDTGRLRQTCRSGGRELNRLRPREDLQKSNARCQLARPQQIYLDQQRYAAYVLRRGY